MVEIKIEHFDVMCRHNAKGAYNIEWVIATMLTLKYGDKRTREYMEE